MNRPFKWQRAHLGFTTLAYALMLITAQPVDTTGQTPKATSGMSNGCQCPQIPRLATDAEPAVGQAKFGATAHGAMGGRELSLTDLEALLSNREALYRGDWDKALLALAHDLDPGGGLKIWSAPAPPPEDKVGIQEGGLSELLVKGYSQARQGSNWSRTSEAPEVVMSGMILTLARANKYGEPVFNLRKSTTRAARFLMDDLANVPPDAMRTDEKARRIGSVAFRTRGQLIAMPGVATPQAIDGWRAAMAKHPTTTAVAKSDDLTLDEFDLASAALDLIMSVDEKGHHAGMFAYHFQDGRLLVSTLLRLISARAVFGGPATPGSPQDAVGCKSFSILVALADASAADGAHFREDIWRELLSGQNELDPQNRPIWYRPMFEAARTVFLLAGVSSADEGKKYADSLLQYENFAEDAVGYTSNPTPQRMSFGQSRIDDYVTTMQAMAGMEGGPGRFPITRSPAESVLYET